MRSRDTVAAQVPAPARADGSSRVFAKEVHHAPQLLGSAHRFGPAGPGLCHDDDADEVRERSSRPRRGAAGPGRMGPRDGPSGPGEPGRRRRGGRRHRRAAGRPARRPPRGRVLRGRQRRDDRRFGEPGQRREHHLRGGGAVRQRRPAHLPVPRAPPVPLRRVRHADGAGPGPEQRSLGAAGRGHGAFSASTGRGALRTRAAHVARARDHASPAAVRGARASRARDAARSLGVPSGQWTFTQQYGWVWMPYGAAYTFTPDYDNGDPYMYVYYPSAGWTWVTAPWLWGWGPMPFVGVSGGVNFVWYGRGWGPRWHGSAAAALPSAALPSAAPLTRVHTDRLPSPGQPGRAGARPGGPHRGDRGGHRVARLQPGRAVAEADAARRREDAGRLTGAAAATRRARNRARVRPGTACPTGPPETPVRPSSPP